MESSFSLNVTSFLKVHSHTEIRLIMHDSVIFRSYTESVLRLCNLQLPSEHKNKEGKIFFQMPTIIFFPRDGYSN